MNQPPQHSLSNRRVTSATTTHSRWLLLCAVGLFSSLAILPPTSVHAQVDGARVESSQGVAGSVLRREGFTLGGSLGIFGYTGGHGASGRPASASASAIRSNGSID